MKIDIENVIGAENDWLKCSICHHLVWKIRLLPCEHYFCKLCIIQWLEKEETCPECREHANESSLTEPSLLARRALEQVKVKCQYEDCLVEISFTEIEIHEIQCAMKEISCELCQQLVPRSTMTSHRYEDPACLRAQIQKLKASQDLTILKEKHKEELEKEAKSHQSQLNKLIKTVNIEFPETTIFHLFVPCNEKHETTSINAKGKQQYLMSSSQNIKYQNKPGSLTFFVNNNDSDVSCHILASAECHGKTSIKFSLKVISYTVLV